MTEMTKTIEVRVEPTTPPARRRKRRPTLAPYLLSAPAMILFLMFTVIPVGYTLVMSFFAMRLTGTGVLGGTRTSVFVGVENYTAVVQDREFFAGLGRLAIYGMIAVPLTLGLALLFALLLDTAGVRLKRFGRVALFIPYAVPGVVGALLWGFMYLPETSPFSYITQAMGLGSIPFLEREGLYGALANIAIWGGVGFNMLVIYTTLRAIPGELVEAARLDGASEMQIALRIKIPLVVPALILTGVFGLIGALQLYGEPVTLKPLSNAITETWAPLMTIYRDAFTLDNLPQAAAASNVLAIGTAVLSLAVLWIVRSFNRRSTR